MNRCPVVVIAPARDAHVAVLAGRVRDLGAPVVEIDDGELVAGRTLAIAASGDVMLDGRPLFPACVYLRALGPARTAMLVQALTRWSDAGIAIYDGPLLAPPPPPAPPTASGDGDAFVLDDEVIAATGVATTDDGAALCRWAAAARDARFARVALDAGGGALRAAAVDASPDFLDAAAGDDIGARVAARLAGWTRRFPLQRLARGTAPPSLTPRSLLPLARS